MKELKALNHYFLRYKSYLLWGMLFVLLNNLMRVYPPVLIGKSLDLVKEELSNSSPLAESQLDNTIFKFGAIILGLALLKGLFMYLMRQTLIVMSRKIEFDLRNDIFRQYEMLSVDFYKLNKTGDLMSRVTEDVGKVRMYLGPAIMYALNTFTLFVMIIGTMLNTHFWLTIIVLLPLPLLSASIYYLDILIGKKSELIQIKLANLTSIAQESYSGIKVVQAFAREQETMSRFDEACLEYRNGSLDLTKYNSLYFPLMIFFIGLSTILVIYFGALESTKGYFTSGLIAQFIIFVGMLTWPVTSIGWVASIIQRAEASQKRINEFLSLRPTIENNSYESFKLAGDVEFQQVSFTYPETGVQALNNISFKIPKGQKLGIIGKTGSGKSSIAELLLRKYDTKQGKVLIDGQEIANINLFDYRRQIGYVPQDVFLFSESIRDNICFGLPDHAPDQAILNSTEIVSIRNEIEGLPKGLDTVIGERGVTLSGGQKQRIALARALIKNPELLVLDDTFSAVDAHTESHISNYLNEYLVNKTAVVITSRLLHSIEFDQIIVMDAGEIAEQGSPKELIEKRGYYYELWSKNRMMNNN